MEMASECLRLPWQLNRTSFENCLQVRISIGTVVMANGVLHEFVSSPLHPALLLSAADFGSLCRSKYSFECTSH